jgi:hypothetical protein
MNKNTDRHEILIDVRTLLWIALLGSPAFGQTNPAAFTTITEQVVHGASRPIDITRKCEVDDRSAIQINFNSANMSPPAPTVPGAAPSPQVTVRVQVYAITGTTRTAVAPIPNYVENVSGGTPPAAAAGPNSSATSTIVNHDHSYNPGINSTVPNTVFDLQASGVSTADQLEVDVTNLETREQLILFLIPKTFGLHAKVSDTVMFVKRLGISQQDQKNGISAFNFGPAPGVTYGGTYYARKNELMRFLQPGAGITVLFTKWNGTAIYNAATGQFVPGTTSSDIQTALGGQVSVFAGVLQAGYGANLQVDQKRQYFSLGLSFVNLASKLSGLIGH